MNQRRKSMRVLALCLAVILGLLAAAGCNTAMIGNQVYRLTPEPDFSQSGRTAELTAEEAAPVGEFSLALMAEAVARAHEEGAENPVLSPVSVYLAMLLTAMGSSGNSRLEFERLLRLPAGEWGRYGGQLMCFMNRSGDTGCLMTANSLWIDEGAQIREEYLDRVSEELYSEVFETDLSTEDAKKAVNQWVDERTNGMIPELRSEPYSDQVLLAILNAVYLDARWEEPFSRNSEVVKTFYGSDGREVETAFLSEWVCWRDYVKGDGLEGILLPYRDGGLAFLALRATDGRTPEELLGALTVQEIRRLASEATNTCMNFSMPKFTLEYEQELTKTVAALGLDASLTPGMADFGEMGAGPDGEAMYISAVNQKVKIQVDEEGTKAAAVTEVTMAGGAAMEDETLELHLDSPYLYMIIQRETGLPLFMGIMENPAAAQ